MVEEQTLKDYLLEEYIDAISDLKVYDTYDMSDQSRYAHHIKIHTIYRKLDEMGYQLITTLEKKT